MNEFGPLINILVSADAALVLGLVTTLLVIAMTVVRRVRPECVWMMITAAMIELVAMILMQWGAPALLEPLSGRIEANPSIAMVISPVVSLVDDVLQALAMALVLVTLVRVAKGPAVSAR
jgi:Na+-transporting NADH:ubiquinone oxidoreductase subunit NqrD